MGDVKVAVPATPAQRFKANLDDLVGLLSDTLAWVPSQGVASPIDALTMGFAKMYVSSMGAESSVHGFIEKSGMYWESIRAKDIDFLITNSDVLFAELPKDKVKAITSLFAMKNTAGDPLIHPDTLASIWDLLHAMVRCSIQHIHTTRSLKEFEEEQEVVDSKGVKSKVKVKVKRYAVEYFPTISVRKMVELWNVKM
ncbi:Hypothetical protein POVN_LOCUS378 [uncultured virus]|nr:Hypothetical protein POVN_LOCUS378 [uncultured virus]